MLYGGLKYQISVFDKTNAEIQTIQRRKLFEKVRLKVLAQKPVEQPKERNLHRTWKQEDCGKFADLSICEGDHNHRFARLLRCHKEWCKDCGKGGSEEHNRRMARWIPKAQKMRNMAYIVITIPKEKREDFEDIEYVRTIRRRIIRGLKDRGYYLGLSRFHWFGKMTMINPEGKKAHKLEYDEAMKFIEDHPGWTYEAEFHPHLNILVPKTWMNIEDLKKMIAKILHISPSMVNLHTQFYKNTHKDIFKKIHKVKYVTRATFRNYDWNCGFADELYGFNNTMCWGSKKNWDMLPDAWCLPEDERKELKKFIDLQKMICPVCGSSLHRLQSKDPINGKMKTLKIQSKHLISWGFHENAYGYMVFQADS